MSSRWPATLLAPPFTLPIGLLSMCSDASPAQAAPSATMTRSAVAAGRRATRAPTPDQTRDSSRPAAPGRGTRGQNAARPVTSSSAGRKVACASSAATMPTAPTGPSPCSEAESAVSRQSIAQVTVAAEAARVGRVARSAAAIAPSVVAWCRSSSR